MLNLLTSLVYSITIMGLRYSQPTSNAGRREDLSKQIWLDYRLTLGVDTT